MSVQILVVEDERDLAATVAYNLEQQGYSVKTAHTGAEALSSLEQRPPNLVLLDLMLPDMSGTEICRKLKADDKLKHIPVIMLTAKGEEIDRVVGFEVGADDYVVKPFSVRELMLRVRALLRRASAEAAPMDTLTAGILRVEIDAHRVWVEQQEVVLTALEFLLLTTLMQRKGRAQTRDALLRDVWDMQADVTTRTVDTHIKRLRSKLGQAGKYIETLRGTGYRFRAEGFDQ